MHSVEFPSRLCVFVCVCVRSDWIFGAGELSTGVHQGLLPGSPFGNMLSKVVKGRNYSSEHLFPSILKNTVLLVLPLRRSVSLPKSGCQDSCQHTSCSSCLLLKPPACPQTCSDSDSACQRHFGKCVRSSLAAGHSDPSDPLCLSNLQVGGREAAASAPHSSGYTVYTQCVFSCRATLTHSSCVWSRRV